MLVFSVSIASRIRLGFAALVVIGLGVSGVSVLWARMIDARIGVLSDVSNQKDRLIAANLALERLQSAETSFRLSGDRAVQEEMKTALANVTEFLAKARTHATSDAETASLTTLSSNLEGHTKKIDAFLRLSRSADAARASLLSVGDRLSTATNSLVDALETDAGSEQVYAVHLVDRKIQVMRLASLQFLAARDAERVRSFGMTAKGVETVMKTATPMLGPLAKELPPLLGMVAEYRSLFSAWADAALETDRIYSNELRPEITQAQASLDALSDTASQAFATVRDAAIAESAAGTSMELSLGIAALLGGGILAVLVVRSIITPLRASTAAMQRLADGDHVTEVPYTVRRDEIGAMARTLAVFRDNAVAATALGEEQRQVQAAQIRRGTMMEALILRFEQSVAATMQHMTQASATMETTAGDLSTTAEQSRSQSLSVASAAEQTSASVQTVASAAEELTASIQEISRQVGQSAQVAQRAVQGADHTDATVKRLAQGAQKIGEVVQLISSIAAQTNLLALNATIEAARAGDAGKGFAVVAGEVKALANQTARATEEISTQISAIQGATQEAVRAIADIAGIIGEINEIGVTVAAAVEQQGAATAEIARNVEQAARGTQDVSTGITDVRKAADRTGGAAQGLHGVAADVSRQSMALSEEIAQFTQAVKAA